MAEKTIYVKLGLQGAEEIQNALDKLGKAGEAAFAKIRAAADKSAPGAGSKIDAGFAKLKASYDSISKATVGFQKSIAFAGQSFNGFNSAVASTSIRLGALKLAFDTVAGAVFLLGKSAIDTVDELDRQSQALGFTIQGYTDLVGAAEASSVEQDKLAAALQKVNVFFENQADAADKAANKLENQIEAIRDSNKDSEDQADAIEKAARKAADAASEEADALDKLGLSYEQLKDKSPEERIYAIADAFAAAGSSAERNAIGVELFGKGALKLVAFLSQGSAEIKRQAAEFRRYGFSVDDAQLKIAQLGDQALDKLSLAIRGARLQLGLLFVPAVTSGANAFAEFLADNLDVLKEWGTKAAQATGQIVNDIIAALKGLDGQVSNRWILTIRDGILAIPPLVQSAIGFISAAFDGFALALSPLATALNGLFGTEFTGRSLAAAAIFLKFIGGFRLFGAAIRLFVIAPVNLFISALNTLLVVIPKAITGLRALGEILLVAGPALISFIAANPVLAAVIVTVAALAAGIAYLYTRQTEMEKALADATVGYGEYEEAARKAADGTKAATDALLEQQEALLNNRRLAILDAREQVAAAQAQLDGIKAAQEKMSRYGLSGSFEATKAMAVKELADAVAVLTQREKNLADAQRKVADTKADLANTKKLTEELPKLGEAADKAADGFIRIKIHMGGAYTKIQEVPREAAQAAKEVAESSTKIDEALKNPTKANDDLLANVKQRAEAFVTSMEEIVTRYKNLTAAIKDETAGMETGVTESFKTFSTDVTASFEEVKSRISTILDAIGAKWDAVFNKIVASAATLNDRLAEVGTSQPNPTAGILPSLGGDPLANQTSQSIKNAAEEAAAAWADAETSITASFNRIGQVGVFTGAKIGVAFTGLWVDATTAFGALSGVLQNAFAGAVQGIVLAASQAGAQISAALSGAFDGLTAAAATVAAEVRNIFASMVAVVEAQISRLRAVLASLRAQIAAASREANSSSGGEKKAYGGMIYGIGGPTQDNIPIWASAGEFMIRAAAVKKIPLAFLKALNSGRYDFGDLMRRFMNLRFADGGLIGMPSISMPSFALSGAPATGPVSALTLVLGGETFAGLSGPADTIARLERAAKIRKIRSTGRQNPYA